jgi:hypothetical protein
VRHASDPLKSIILTTVFAKLLFGILLGGVNIVNKQEEFCIACEILIGILHFGILFDHNP